MTAMTLHSIANFPGARCYVLKLHRDADPAAGALLGRLEHMASGSSVDFHSGSELLAWLQQHADQVQRALADGERA
jgi:hypothetical protein